MTPFGERVRELRRLKGTSQKEMAAALGVTPAYLSALEHGRRGAPTWPMVQKIIGYFNVIWDEADELQALASQSHGRVVVDTAGLSPRATELANMLAGQAGSAGDQVRHLQRRQRVELADAEGLPGVERLHEHGAEPVVGIGAPVDVSAAEGAVPHRFAAGPLRIAAAFSGAFGKLRTGDQLAERFPFVGKREI
ncbi:MAG: helix-turn-helix transcriptional regulator [Phyllobacteriaceae bacterium]|nr:helix-turn-helix transcriptional regulator [Phyllobacteriaceae bacterium]